MKIRDLIREIKKYKGKYICWTGGEPLLRRDMIQEVINKTDLKFHHIETNGDLLLEYDFNFFSYLGISPKELKTAKKVKKIMKGVIKNYYDIKIVTDLKKEGIDMLKYATILMPLSTNNIKEDKLIQEKVWNYCVKHNIKYTPRLQVDLWGLKTKGI